MFTGAREPLWRHKWTTSTDYTDSKHLHSIGAENYENCHLTQFGWCQLIQLKQHGLLLIKSVSTVLLYMYLLAVLDRLHDDIE